MNKKIVTVLITSAILSLPMLAFAQANPTGVQVGGIQNLIDIVLRIIWAIFGLIAVIAFVTAGTLFLAAQGQPDKIATARTAFIWGVVGVVVGIVAFSIIQIVKTALQGGF